MSGEQYMQVRRPVSRLAEKVLGWLSWVFLLLLTIATMFVALVSFSSETSIQNLETSLNGNQFIQQILANNSMTTTQAGIWLQNGIWAVIVFLIVCLLISFLALISMNIRMLSGFLFLIATLITLPLVLLFVTLIIPVLFLIVSIMMFARKEKVEAIPAYYGYDDDYEDDVYEPAKKRRNGRVQQETTVEPEPEPEEQHSEPVEDVEADTEKNSLRRGGYSSEVARQVNADIADEEPQVLSRQAKYNYKKKKDDNTHDDDFGQVSSVYGEGNDDYVSQEEKKKQEEMQRQQAEEERRKQQEAEEKARIKQEKAEEAQRLKQEKAEEKSRIKEEKKERKKRIKEKRKQQPSAVAQRRMNYEERKKVTSQDVDNQAEDTQQDEKEK
ncbi:lipoteichoic acid stability factor AuxB [Staphylococcus arlettae]|uniref:lipoteichoic acid stability factor AuxB n=1 Tax=Staphylococcus arlettae TaxID=29378 RepID=UPI000DCCE7C2|nr:DUF4064 domain-containing protein [Staphylococcus arlettae]RBA03228.1 hypothetical protein DOD23_1113 [Staphylococcus arlettae]RBA05662.1 hypothetical protein DOD22_0041 [Staphylococcus arlettae]RBA06589.1 hypothetical protein DOD24_1942 [Staphylococcus arlettae]